MQLRRLTRVSWVSRVGTGHGPPLAAAAHVSPPARGWRLGVAAALALVAGCSSVVSDERRICDGVPCHAVMLSNLDTDCTASGGAITCARTSAAANVIYASEATEAGFTAFDARTVIFAGVTSWTSERGASPIVLTTPRATVTATYGTDRYAISGLARPFDGEETLTVTAPGASPAVAPVTLEAPAGPPRFGTLEGLRTEVRLPDGGFDALFVYARDAAGASGVLYEIDAADMTRRGSDRVAPILPDPVIAELASRGIVLVAVTLGPYRDVETTVLFPTGAAPVQAGYLVEVPVSELGTTAAPDAGPGSDAPPGPDAGTDAPSAGIDAHCFFDLPVTIAGGSDGTSAVICTATGVCRLIEGTTCPSGTTLIGSFGWSGGAPIVEAERIDLSTHGDLPARGRVTSIPLATDVRTEIGRGSEGYEVRYRVEGTSFVFSNIAGGAPIDPVSATCAELPASWLVRLGSAATSAGSVCANSAGTTCEVASPGVGCDVLSAFDVRFSVDGSPELVALAGTWSFTSSSHGTFAADVVTALPRRTDVTVELERTTGLSATAVVRFDGTSVEIRSVSLTP